MTNPQAPSFDDSGPSRPTLQALPAEPMPGHCGLRKRHLTHRFVAGDPPEVFRCRGASVPPVGAVVRDEDPHWLARAGVGAPW